MACTVKHLFVKRIYSIPAYSTITEWHLVSEKIDITQDKLDCELGKDAKQMLDVSASNYSQLKVDF